MKHLFTYGTLMFTEIWSLVVRGSYQSQSGTISGFIRKSVRDREYPVIYQESGKPPVHGIVYFNVTPADIYRLDGFEGAYYVRQNGPVVLTDQSVIEAEIYVLKPRYQHIVDERDWDPDYFKIKGMKNLIDSYRGFNDTGTAE